MITWKAKWPVLKSVEFEFILDDGEEEEGFLENLKQKKKQINL